MNEFRDFRDFLKSLVILPFAVFGIPIVVLAVASIPFVVIKLLAGGVTFFLQNQW